MTTACDEKTYELDSANADDAMNKLNLDKHNEYRANHGAMPLAYNAELAAEAKAYAQVLEDNRIATGTPALVHTPGLMGQGENLYFSSNPATVSGTT